MQMQRSHTFLGSRAKELVSTLARNMSSPSRLRQLAEQTRLTRWNLPTMWQSYKANVISLLFFTMVVRNIIAIRRQSCKRPAGSWLRRAQTSSFASTAIASVVRRSMATVRSSMGRVTFCLTIAKVSFGRPVYLYLWMRIYRCPTCRSYNIKTAFVWRMSR